AYHFCDARVPQSTQATAFVRSIAAMLCANVDAYARKLQNDGDLVSKLKIGDPTTMLRDGILAPLRDIPMDGVRYIVVDALDEAVLDDPADAAGSEVSIPQLLA